MLAITQLSSFLNATFKKDRGKFSLQVSTSRIEIFTYARLIYMLSVLHNDIGHRHARVMYLLDSCLYRYYEIVFATIYKKLRRASAAIRGFHASRFLM